MESVQVQKNRRYYIKIHIHCNLLENYIFTKLKLKTNKLACTFIGLRKL